MAFEPNQVNIKIKGVPQTITPTITPTPNYYLSSTLTYSAVGNYWGVSIWSSSSETLTYTISATGYDSGTLNVSQNYTGNLEITLTEAKPEHLYAWTDNNVTGTPLYAWTSNRYYSDSGRTIPLTYYTTSATPTSGDAIYYANGVTVNTVIGYDSVDYYGMTTNTITSYSNNTITIGGQPGSGGTGR